MKHEKEKTLTGS